MDAYHVVLYVHILSLLIGISAGVVATVCLLKLEGRRRWRTLRRGVSLGPGREGVSRCRSSVSMPPART
jgi:hypothetical protein